MTCHPPASAASIRQGYPHATLLVLGIVLSGCGAAMIPNTDVEDSAENREVVEFMEGYRHAVEHRDISKLLEIASKDYYDDSGTPNAADDVDYDVLGEKLVVWKARLIKVRYEIRYRRITRVRDQVFVDFTYTGSFHINEGDDERAVRRLEDNRVVLAQNDDGFQILSGM